MKPEILEKALHAWPQWRELIHEARTRMNFRPDFLEIEGRAEKWEKEVGWERVVRLGLETMRRLRLPWYFSFYWLACFCADYERGDSVDFSRINLPPQNASSVWTDLVGEELVKDRGIVMLYHKGGSGGKLYPPYPFILETSFLFGIKRGQKPSDSVTYSVATLEKNGKKEKVDGLFEVDKNGSLITGKRTLMSIIAPAGTYLQIFCGRKRKIPSEFRIEFPTFLATDDVVNMAFKQIQVYREGDRHYMSHPLLKHIGPAKVRTDVFGVTEMSVVKDEIAQYQKGKLTFEDLISREWERELKRGGLIALRLKNRQISQSKAKTVIYYRVRKRLRSRVLIPSKPQKGWRSSLKL